MIFGQLINKININYLVIMAIIKDDSNNNIINKVLTILII